MSTSKNSKTWNMKRDKRKSCVGVLRKSEGKTFNSESSGLSIFTKKYLAVRYIFTGITERQKTTIQLISIFCLLSFWCLDLHLHDLSYAICVSAHQALKRAPVLGLEFIERRHFETSTQGMELVKYSR
jgi:hypothetical protein